MKKGTVSLLVASALLGASSLVSTPAFAQTAEEPADVMRAFAGFITDAETTRGLRGEFGTVYARETDFAVDTHAFNTALLLSYGREAWEAGVQLPYGYLDIDGGGTHSGFGDLSLWGKFLPIRTEQFTFGGGLVAQMPTGNDPRFSPDEYGFQPFVTGGVTAGKANIRGHVGYQVFTDIDVLDSIDYSVAGYIPVGAYSVVRAELVGQHFTDVDFDPLSIIVGVDLRSFDQNTRLVVRPTVGAGITQDAPDFQVGLSFVLGRADL